MPDRPNQNDRDESRSFEADSGDAIRSRIHDLRRSLHAVQGARLRSIPVQSDNREVPPIATGNYLTQAKTLVMNSASVEPEPQAKPQPMPVAQPHQEPRKELAPQPRTDLSPQPTPAIEQAGDVDHFPFWIREANIVEVVPKLPLDAPLNAQDVPESIRYESPDEWFERMWGETGDYSLDPDSLETSQRETETRTLIDTNRNTLPLRIARFSIAKPWLTIFLWIALLAAISVAGALNGTSLARDDQVTSGESREAQQLLRKRDFLYPATEIVLMTPQKVLVPSNKDYDKASKHIRTTFENHELISKVVVPTDPGARELLTSDDYLATIARLELKGDPTDSHKRITEIQKLLSTLSLEHRNLRFRMLGYGSAKKATIDTSERMAKLSEYLTVPIIILILVTVLGSIRAATIPAILAVGSVAAAIGTMAFVSIVQPASYLISAVITLVGMAVGTDYAFFVLQRVREERMYGRSLRDSVLVACATSGRSIIISGITVAIAMSGMFLSDNVDFKSIATGTAVVVLFSVVGALTVIPAIMMLMKDSVITPRSKRMQKMSMSDNARRLRLSPWARLVRMVLNRPLIPVVVTTTALLLLAMPAIHMKTLMPDFTDVNNIDSEDVKTYHSFQEHFPGEFAPAVVAMDSSGIPRKALKRELEKFRMQALDTKQMQDPIISEVSEDGNTVRISVPLKGRETDDESKAGLLSLRNEVIPGTIGKFGRPVKVTGPTAENHDFNKLMKERTPLIFCVVIVFTFLILLASFRSIVIPIKATVLNMLSVGATYGALVIVFQHGFGSSLIGANTNGGVIAWLPLFLFVVLFGLSMDYHIFILSRIRELWLQGEDPQRAVVMGIGGTSRTISAAAMVMVGVFGVFIAMPTLDMKQLGFGLTVGIALDAWVIRGILLPGSMKMLGVWNWYLPGWLNWIPDLAPHGKDEGMKKVVSPYPDHIPMSLALDMGRVSHATNTTTSTIDIASISYLDDEEDDDTGAHEVSKAA